MIPRKPTQADCDFWGDGATVGPMLGRHVGAEIPSGTGQADTYESRTEILWSNRPLLEPGQLFTLAVDAAGGAA